MEISRESQFLNMVEENKGVIFKIASLYTDTREDREDLMQEIAFQLWKSIDSFQQKSTASTWLYRVALNTAIFFLKKGKKHHYQELNEQVFQQPLENEEEKIIQEKQLLKAIKKLPALDKGIVILYLEEKSHQEIADIVGITKTNVGTRLGRIKKKLKEYIQNTAL